MKIKLLSTAAVVALVVAGGAIAAGDPMVGGAPMYATNPRLKIIALLPRFRPDAEISLQKIMERS